MGRRRRRHSVATFGTSSSARSLWRLPVCNLTPSTLTTASGQAPPPGPGHPHARCDLYRRAVPVRFPGECRAAGGASVAERLARRAPIVSSRVERVRGLDTAFLYLETPTTHLHVAWAVVLDTRERPDAASPRRVCELIGGRLHLLPALRRRLADPRLGYTQPDWVDVDVDPADHCRVHHSADLEAVAADVLARPLDRHRPLWEIHVVEGLPDGRTGMIMKLHHAVLDGPSGAEPPGVGGDRRQYRSARPGTWASHADGSTPAPTPTHDHVVTTTRP